MAVIRSSVQSQKIDDEIIMKITRLTISTLERLSSTVGNNTLQIDRVAVSPKELYRRMKTFDRRDRETFLERYESYLQTMFVMKIVNDDANNLNLITMRKTSSSNTNMLSNTLGTNSSEVQIPRRQALAPKSNITANSISMTSLELNCNRKMDRNQADVAAIDRSDVYNVSIVTNIHENYQEFPHAIDLKFANSVCNDYEVICSFHLCVHRCQFRESWISNY